MLWIKAFHIVFVITWFAGLFYLPRLFVYHAMSTDQVSLERFKIMERKLFRGIMTPSAVLALLSGIALLHYVPGHLHTGWMVLKLVLVGLLIFYHVWCGVILKAFREDQNTRSHVWYRWFNEAPVVALVGIIVLVIVRPF